MKTFNTQNVTNTRQFKTALSTVFGSIAQRNEQIQQLLMLALSEATKLGKDGSTTNNLSWFNDILVIADNTKGVNATKIATYVKEVLCLSTVTWDAKKSVLKKSAKAESLQYDIVPSTSWYDYGKKDSVKAAFDYEKRITTMLINATDSEKGNLSTEQIADSIVKAGISITDLVKAMNKQQEESIDF